MKIIRYLLLSVLIIDSHVIFSQSTYLVGTSQTSIEPDQSLISLHLGGYGLPKEGRFSLQWINKGKVPEVTAMGTLPDKIYIVSNGNLMWMNTTNNNREWKKAGKQ